MKTFQQPFQQPFLETLLDYCDYRSVLNFVSTSKSRSMQRNWFLENRSVTDSRKNFSNKLKIPRKAWASNLEDIKAVVNSGENIIHLHLDVYDVK